MFTIVGATGSVGSIVAQQLLQSGKRVRIISRSKERLAPLVAKGAEPFVVRSVLDETAMARAFEGAIGAFTMAPAASAEIRYAEAGRVMAQAVSKTGVSHVVNISAMGAHLPESGAYRADYRDLEAAFNEVEGINVIHLRPGLFMKSFFSWIEQIKSKNQVRGLFRGDLPVPRIASRDIAAVAAEALLGLGFSGINVRELHGQRDVSMNEAAMIIGNAIGNPSLRYVQVSPQQWIDVSVSKGLSVADARGANELYIGWNNGAIHSMEKRSAVNTTPTTLETFVTEEFLPRFDRLHAQ